MEGEIELYNISFLILKVELHFKLLVANVANTKLCKKNTLKMTETRVHGYSSESIQRELSNEY